MNKFISFIHELQIQSYISDSILFIKRDESPVVEKYFVNKTATEIIMLINGTKTLDEIFSILSDKYNDDYNSVKNNVLEFLKEIETNFKLQTQLLYEPKYKEIPIKIFENNYPTVASIELTYKCNLRCLHCYGEYGESSMVMDKDRAIQMLRDFKELGIRLVEFTGGDISVYPHLKDILTEAIKLDFDFIGLLTNSVVLNNDIKELIIKNNKKIVIQIDLHSLKDSYLKWFTKSENTVEIIKNNIIQMVRNNVITRVAMIVTKKNLDEIEEIADWSHSIGVKQLVVSPVINIGRAQQNDKNLLLDDKTSVDRFNDMLVKVNNKYPNFLCLKESIEDKRENCGTLTSNVVISPKGDIKFCASDELKYNIPIIGNVFNDKIKDIYDNNSEYVKALISIKKPEHDNQDCKNCKNKFFCSGCLLRAFLKRKEIGDDCKWYKNQVPQIVKTKLQL